MSAKNKNLPTKPVSLALVGLGGYGTGYLNALFEDSPPEPFSLEGIVDPAPMASIALEKAVADGVSLFPSLEEFYREKTAELVILGSPIQLHCPHACLCLSHGSHVLCEKPAAATIQDVNEMIRARDQAERDVAVGFQWSFQPSLQELKKDMLSGRFGTPVRMKSIYLWKRDKAYYGRNDWAGRQKDIHGKWVLDSPLNNAFAHDVHNMFYLLGNTIESSAQPVSITAELYRANPIENFDTLAMRARTENNVEILFFGSHTVPKDLGPLFSFEFTEAVITFEGGKSPMIACFKNGNKKEYLSPETLYHFTKIWVCIRAVREGSSILCGLEASKPLTLCVNGAQESVADIPAFSEKLLRASGEGEHKVVWVDGLREVLKSCYEKNILPSEAGAPWAEKGKTVDLRGYSYFPSESANIFK